MQRVLIALAAALLLLPGSVGASWPPAACGPAADGCCCAVPEASTDGPALTAGCCCEVRPQEGAPQPEQPRIAGGDAPADHSAPLLERGGPPRLPAAAPVRDLRRCVEPRAPPGPLHLLHGVFLC